MIKVIPKFNELKVDLNYQTGSHSENNCRIVTKGSELDLMYQKVYEDYIKVTTGPYVRTEGWYERIGESK